MQVEWANDLLNQCLDVNIPFFFKQHGGKQRDEHGVWGGRLLNGKEWNEYPSIGEQSS